MYRRIVQIRELMKMLPCQVITITTLVSDIIIIQYTIYFLNVFYLSVKYTREYFLNHNTLLKQHLGHKTYHQLYHFLLIIFLL